MQKVKLLGELSQFGAEWTVSCKSINDIFKLISCQSPTFKKYLIDCEQKGLDLEIIKGKYLEVFPKTDDKFINDCKKILYSFYLIVFIGWAHKKLGSFPYFCRFIHRKCSTTLCNI